MPCLLQFDFPFSGPWGDQMAGAMQDLARSIAQEPGLRWKIWTENEATGEAGGIYLFEDVASAQAYHRSTRNACAPSASRKCGPDALTSMRP